MKAHSLLITLLLTATAKIEGEKVIVTSPDVKTPVAVRYAWKDDPKADLVNGAGLPASPFRSHAWLTLI